jgi:hypothetical protein
MAYADGHAKFTRWVDDWLPANQQPWIWNVYNPRRPVDQEKACTPTCAVEGARE